VQLRNKKHVAVSSVAILADLLQI